jgi:hypothetical protein
MAARTTIWRRLRRAAGLAEAATTDWRIAANCWRTAPAVGRRAESFSRHWTMSAAHGSGIGRDRRFELFGHAEIQQLHMTRLADHHIGGLDVSVNDSGVVGGFECRCDLLAVRKHIVNRQVTGPNLLFNDEQDPWRGRYLTRAVRAKTGFHRRILAAYA